MLALTTATRRAPLRGVLTRQFPRGVARGRYVTSGAATLEDEGSAETQQLTLKPQEGWLFVDSVFPIRLGTLDPRHYIGLSQEEQLLTRLTTILNAVKTYNFQVQSVEPHNKDGGVFVKFTYTPEGPGDAALDTILHELRQSSAKHGGIPSWTRLSSGDIWVVKGKPWREDMHHFASPILKVSFEGPDIREESLYNLLRPYGRIVDIAPPTPPPAGALRAATVTFRHLKSAAIARNTLHGLTFTPDESSTVTRLRTKYQQPLQAHAVRDYISSHPKIFLPIFIFLFGSITYTVFDPIRVFMVEGKLNDWFDFRQYQFYQWLRSNTVERFSLSSSSSPENPNPPTTGVWKERQEAEGALNKYLSDLPSTVAFVHGPQGSGKSRMLHNLLKDSHRRTLVIDVGELANAGSDTALVSSLARQTGYWPVFSFLNSMNNLIDLASVGLIGQKAGLSSSLGDQLKQILEVVGTGLRGVNTSYKNQQAKRKDQERVAELRAKEDAKRRDRIQEGIWHDPRLDCIAGNGVMSELGIGDEWFGANDADGKSFSSAETTPLEKRSADNAEEQRDLNEKQEEKQKQISSEDMQAIEAMPIVILRGFDSRGGSARREELLNVLTQWAASLAQSQVAHVVVVSDNRENAKLLARALPSKPLNQIALSDADSGSALSFVKQKLHDAGVDINFTKEQTAYIERLGGRASDLESLVHKVRSGLTIQEAVNDIVARGISELRKNAFGDDTEEAKNLPWTREQAWALMKQLANNNEIPYHDILLDFPFKGDETALRQMEHAELIAITTHDGRPAGIRPGKPVYKYVFEKLVHDPVFQATQEIAFNQKIIATNEATVRACEEELMTLKEVEAGTSHWWGSRRAVSGRGEYLLRKMRAAGEKIEALEKKNAQLKKTLSKIQ